MHKLDRTGVAPPACLATYNYKAQSWDDLAPVCKRELRAALVLMQGIPGVTTPDANEYGLRCAYCEGTIFHEGHIEHFRRKNAKHFPQLTFAWNNLFLACGSNEHCGHYKDRRGALAYDPAQLIKPDQDEPDSYLYFHSSGEVRARAGLNPVDASRANETIRVFGLDDRTLAGSRAKSISIYKRKVASDLDELASWPFADRQAYLAGEVDATRYEPYATTVKHFLQSAA
jgi:uncharacterized protein (TIGR02646 family)